jgi:hypothetical protein
VRVVSADLERRGNSSELMDFAMGLAYLIGSRNYGRSWAV